MNKFMAQAQQDFGPIAVGNVIDLTNNQLGHNGYPVLTEANQIQLQQALANGLPIFVKGHRVLSTTGVLQIYQGLIWNLVIQRGADGSLASITVAPSQVSPNPTYDVATGLFILDTVE